MRRKQPAGEPDLLVDPFHERSGILTRGPLKLLGARYLFESNSQRLLRLVDDAYAGLPGSRNPAPDELRIRLVEMQGTGGARKSVSDEPPPLEMFSGAGFVGGATDRSSFIVVSPSQGAALVVVGPEMTAFPYHTRYELIEFAVYALIARVHGLISLHAACVGQKGRGVLLMGSSGAGKSTVTLQCLLEGLDFLSEDSVLVTPRTLEATAIASFLHVGADSLRWIPPRWAQRIRKSPVIQRRSGVRKFEVDLRRGGHRLAAPPLKISSVVFLSKEPAAKGRLLVPLSKREVVERLRDAQAYAVQQPNWGTFERGIRSRDVFELRRGNHPREAVEALRELI
jgi:energy-coupling factor transporter ATP-binding protein EcfA2